MYNVDDYVHGSFFINFLLQRFIKHFLNSQFCCQCLVALDKSFIGAHVSLNKLLYYLINTINCRFIKL